MTAPVIPINRKKPRKGDTGAVKKPPTDWEAVERDYRTTNLTMRELGRLHSVSHAAISKKAEKLNWARDLTKAVKQATESKLINAAVKTAVTTTVTNAVTTAVAQSAEVAKTTTEAVMAVAELNKDVILGHRKDIRKVRNLAMTMADELEQVTLNQDKLADFFEVMTEDMDDAALASARRTFQDLVKLPSRIAGAKALSETLTKLQALERTAFSLDDDGQKEGDKAAVTRMTDAERAVRLIDMMQSQQRAA